MKVCFLINNKHFEVISKYDSHYDMLGIRITDDYKYNQSVEMRDGLIVDFDTDNKPVAVQLIGASKLFNVSKSSLHDIPLIDMKIKIDETSIYLDLIIGVHIHNKKLEQNFNSLICNEYSLPNFEAELATN